jgi:hypothetical protein
MTGTTYNAFKKRKIEEIKMAYDQDHSPTQKMVVKLMVGEGNIVQFCHPIKDKIRLFKAPCGVNGHKNCFLQ